MFCCRDALRRAAGAALYRGRSCAISSLRSAQVLGNGYARRRSLCGSALSWLLCLATAAPITLVPTRSSAADATNGERAVARRLVGEGDALFAGRNYAQALERY